MCDILAISAGHKYTPKKYLPIFAEKGKRNMNGWGIGFFRDNEALVEKSCEKVFNSEQVHESFQRLARVIDSRIIVSHISCPLSRSREGAQNHPFSLSFLDHVWLFVHVGVVENIEKYKTIKKPRIEAEVYPARIFEYLRDQMLELLDKNPYASLYNALSAAIKRIIQEYPGHYTFFLANESVLFAFSNFCSLMVRKEFESLENIMVITSIEEGLTSRKWFQIGPEQGAMGKLMVIAGPELLYCQNI